ncbi:hypothetical protein GJ496_003121 [Pomphorhynchus laevis]|nr:hypothetical protein GJ496_003121 [Pomphorhynchus laevis]
MHRNKRRHPCACVVACLLEENYADWELVKRQSNNMKLGVDGYGARSLTDRVNSFPSRYQMLASLEFASTRSTNFTG